MFFIILGMKKEMKRQIKQFNKVMVRQQSPVPEIHFSMCQISRALRSSKRATLCVNAVTTPMAKKVCSLYIVLQQNILTATFILYILLYIMYFPYTYYISYKMLCSSVRQTWMENVLLYIARACVILAQG